MGRENNTFEQSKCGEITTNPQIVYKCNVKITINSKRYYNKLFYLLKKNNSLYFKSLILRDLRVIIQLKNNTYYSNIFWKKILNAVFVTAYNYRSRGERVRL